METNEYDSHFITTFTGKKFHYLAPSWNEICIEDIAHALALTCRFGGHCKTFYSVAEHSYRVAAIVDKKDRLAALLHDAHEAYLHDVPRPIKHDIKGYREIANKIQCCIQRALDITVYFPDHLKFADDVLLATEARDLMPNTQDWADLPWPLDMRIKPVDWRLAERVFLDCYNTISKGRYAD